VATIRWTVEGGMPVIDESSRTPTLPARATASKASMAFKRDFMGVPQYGIIFTMWSF